MATELRTLLFLITQLAALIAASMALVGPLREPQRGRRLGIYVQETMLEIDAGI